MWKLNLRILFLASSFFLQYQCYGPISQNSVTSSPLLSDNNVIKFYSSSSDYGLLNPLSSSNELTPLSNTYWWQNLKSPFVDESCTTGTCEPSVILQIPSESGNKISANNVNHISSFETNKIPASEEYIKPNIVQVTSNSIGPTAVPSFTGILNSIPYPGCAAALKCVPEDYCTVEGVISDVPIVLTKDFLLLRVALSECQDPATGIVGKCCRDPNYKDPWPADLPHEHHHQHHEEHTGSDAISTEVNIQEYSFKPKNQGLSTTITPIFFNSKPSSTENIIPIFAYKPTTQVPKPIGDYGSGDSNSISPFPIDSLPSYGQPVKPVVSVNPSQTVSSPTQSVIPSQSPSNPLHPIQSSTYPPNQSFPPLQQSVISSNASCQPSYVSQSVYPPPSQSLPSSYPSQPTYVSQTIFTTQHKPSKPIYVTTFGPLKPVYTYYPTYGSTQDTLVPVYKPEVSNQQPYPPFQSSYPYPGSQQLGNPPPSYPNGNKPPPPSQSPIYPTQSPQQPHPSTPFIPQQPFYPGIQQPEYPNGSSQLQPNYPSLPSLTPPQQPQQPGYPSKPLQPQVNYPSFPSVTVQQPQKPGYPNPSSQLQPTYPSFPSIVSHPQQPEHPSINVPQPYPPSSSIPPQQPTYPSSLIIQKPLPPLSQSQQQSVHPSVYPQQQYPSLSSLSQPSTFQQTLSSSPIPLQSHSSFPSSQSSQQPESPSFNPEQVYPSSYSTPLLPYLSTPLPEQPSSIQGSQKPYSHILPQIIDNHVVPIQPSQYSFPIANSEQSHSSVIDTEVTKVTPIIIPKESSATCGGVKSNGGIALAHAPWHAIVYSNKNKDLICAAVIISENAVLTAAHCLDNSEAESAEVKIGPKGKIFKVAAIARHTQYEAVSYNRDLALLVLTEPIQFDNFVAKICLPTSFSQKESLERECYVSTMTEELKPESLKTIPVQVFPYNDCEVKLKNTYLGKYFVLNDSFSCVSTPTDDELCTVKTGSPIACNKGDGSYELLGIKSWDLGCQDYKRSAIFSNFDIFWVQNILATPITTLISNEKTFLKAKFKGDSLEGINIQQKPGFSQGYGK